MRSIFITLSLQCFEWLRLHNPPQIPIHIFHDAGHIISHIDMKLANYLWFVNIFGRIPNCGDSNFWNEDTGRYIIKAYSKNTHHQNKKHDTTPY